MIKQPKTNRMMTVLVTAVTSACIHASTVVSASSTVSSFDVALITPISTHEGELRQTIEMAVNGDIQSGAASSLAHSTLRSISLKQSALQALDKNLTLKISRGSERIAEQALAEAQAVFHPTLNAAMSYSRNNQTERTIRGTVRLKQIIVASKCGLGCINDFPAYDSVNPIVIEQGFVTQTAEEDQPNTTITLNTNEDSAKGPTQTRNFTIGLSQELPWGGNISISDVSTNKEVYYNKRGWTYGRPWSSDVSINAQMPVPYLGEGFGAQAANTYNEQLAKKQKDTAYWQVKTAVNSILLSVDNAYWGLVGRYEALFVAMENHKQVADQFKRTERQFKNRVVTRYEMAQTSAELSRVKVAEEQAWQELITASRQLALLIEETNAGVGKTVYIPEDYLEALKRQLDFDPQEFIAQGVKQNPGLRLSQIQLESAELTRVYRQDQLKPTVTVSGSVFNGQDGEIRGYSAWWDSFRRSVHFTSSGNPDAHNQAYSLAVKHPIGNRAAKAALERATDGYRSSELSLQDKQNTVYTNIQNSMAQVYSSRSRVKIALLQQRLTQSAYDRLVKQKNTGEGATELEMILNLRKLLSSKQQAIQATIDSRRAESQLLAATGTISNLYVDRTMQSNLDKMRIKALTLNKVLDFFVPVEFARFEDNQSESSKASGGEVVEMLDVKLYDDPLAKDANWDDDVEGLSQNGVN